MSQDKRLTVRITTEENDMIKILKTEYDLNISALVRRAVRCEYDKKVEKNV